MSLSKASPLIRYALTLTTPLYARQREVDATCKRADEKKIITAKWTDERTNKRARIISSQ